MEEQQKKTTLSPQQLWSSRLLAAEVLTKKQRVLRISGNGQAAIKIWTSAHTMHDRGHLMIHMTELEEEIF